MTPTIIFLGDGMADEPIPKLNGLTPIQHANTPAMDSIARDGVSGTLFTLPEPFPTSSDVANMSVLGCDLNSEFCGRGPLEAAGRNINLSPDDIALRLNLVTVENGILIDYSGGHVNQNIANEIINLLSNNFGNNNVHFYPGVSYRNLLILSGDNFSSEIITEKPDDNQGNPINKHLPRSKNSVAYPTQKFLHKLIEEATPLLEESPINHQLKKTGKPIVNGIWPCHIGRPGSFKSLRNKYGIETSAVISAVDVIIGLGRLLGMEVISVPGATGYIDTNYAGKATAAIKAASRCDLVYVHVEAIDEVSHEQNLKLKIESIENFDNLLVGPVLDALGNDVNFAVLPDHPVPISIGKHTRKPVPVSVRMQGKNPDIVKTFDEISCQNGSLGNMANGELMELLFGKAKI